jgi:uncharacterized membrane protein
LLAFILFSSISLAQVQYYGIDVVLDEAGRSNVKLTITFLQPEKELRFTVFGRVENFKATSIAGPVNCTVDITGVTIVACNLSLTQEKRTLDLSFDTNDFVRPLDNKFYFSGEFGLNKNIDQIFASIKLPEAMFLASGNIQNMFPEGAETVVDGRHVIVIWRLGSIQSNQSLNFRVLYEPLQQPQPFPFTLRHFVAFGVTAASVFAFIIIRYLRRSEKLVLSVLDEYERKAMDVIIAAGGDVDQREVVKVTNLSKAKVSRVVKSLVERGLIKTERIGRKNKLKLIKKKLNL